MMFRFKTPLFVSALALVAACSSDTDDAAPDDNTGVDGTSDGSGGDAQSGPEADASTGSDTGSPIDWPACDTSTASGLAGCVEIGRYTADLEAFSVVRPTGVAANEELRGELVERLESYGYEVEIDRVVGQGTNVIGRLAGSSAADEVVVLSAHLDSVPLCSGADDNATGVAGVLEAARVLALTEHERTLIVAFWDEEERAITGSWSWVDRIVAEDMKVVVSVVFEMIGFTSDEPDSQSFPPGFGFLFPEVADALDANDNRGDFIALISNPSAVAVADAMIAAGDELGLSSVPVNLSEEFVTASTTSDLRRSDHRPFWAFGYPAIMVTDTSEFRYTGYHCADGDDSPDRLDHVFASRTTAAATVAVATALRTDGPPAVSASDALRSCNPVSNEGCGAGEKCSIALLEPGWFGMTCAPLAAEPDARGEACDRPTGVTGIDTCGIGEFCTFWGRPVSQPQERWCQAVCETNADCDEGQVCQSIDETVPRFGICNRACDPFDSATCDAGTHCTGERTDTSGTLVWSCNRIQDFPPDSECGPMFDHCAARLSCGYSAEDGIARCGAPCDEDHPCTGGRTCQIQSNAGGATAGIGVCH